MDFISRDKIAESFVQCIKTGLIEQGLDTTVIFYDYDVLAAKINKLKSAFPAGTIHTTAVKANPLVKILEKIRNNDLGAEVASEGELFLAEKAGFNPSLIVFDSPAKTNNELFLALSKNIHINADSFMELDRIAEIKSRIHSSGKIGLRINPQVGYGTIASTSVAGTYSKFGIPVNEFRTEIIESFKKFEWLSGIHIHIGSQGCSMEMLLAGFEKILTLIIEIESNINRKISFVDIGGGLPVSYNRDINPPDITEYGAKIQGLLFKFQHQEIQLITEFGRYLHANSGFTISKIEYVKHYHKSNTFIIHAGADLFLRECLNPGLWSHEFSLLTNEGIIKSDNINQKYHIAGPLCFAGDIIAKDVELPIAEEGDYLVIHDTGGYTFGMWSRYVSRMFPKVILKSGNIFEIIKNREKPEDLYAFWSL
jgi:diaminopimelate decarboxylase